MPFTMQSIPQERINIEKKSHEGPISFLRHPRVLINLTASDRGMLQPTGREEIHMIVSKKNFILAGTMFEEEAKKFAHAFAIWTKMAEVKGNYENGDVSFYFAEMDTPQKEITEKYVSTVHAACRALFALDRKFYIKEHLHVVGRLENLADMEKALGEIDYFLSA